MSSSRHELLQRRREFLVHALTQAGAAGLAEGDRVIQFPGDTIEDGLRVKPR